MALPPGELQPGTVVGQGRFVLAEKLCEVCHRPGQDSASAMQRHQAQLPSPSADPLMLGDEFCPGQLVPYAGLARAIAAELSQLPSEEPSFLPSVYDYSVSFMRQDPVHQEAWRYRFGQRLGRGSFGEAWRAMTLDGSMREVVLKRLFVERGEHVRRSGEREIYFGTILQNRPHIARFVESFEHEDVSHKIRKSRKKPSELWLVFHNEGFSLTSFLFWQQPGSQVVERSAFWWIVKQQIPLGAQVIKNFAYQLLQGLAVAHSLNITHRDVKGANVFVTDTWPPVLRLGDWGSALKTPIEEVEGLYHPEGPTDADETEGYKPPEAGVFDEELLLYLGLKASAAWREQSYDLWSLGVLLLEIILGTREVFQVDERRWLREEFELRKLHVSEKRIPQGRRLRALLDLCLGPSGTPAGAPLSWFLEAGVRPGPSANSNNDNNDNDNNNNHSNNNSTTTKTTRTTFGGAGCSDEDFAEKLRQRDEAGIGLPSAEGRDLLRRLLRWEPQDRISAQEALAHPWFDDGAQLPPLRFPGDSARSKPPSSKPPAATAAAAPAKASSHRSFQEEPDAQESQEDGEEEPHDPDGLGEELDGQESPQEADTEVSNKYIWPTAAGAEDATDCLTSDATCKVAAVAGHGERRTPPGAGGHHGSQVLASGCPGLRLHAAAFGDIGRRRTMEDRHALHNLTANYNHNNNNNNNNNNNRNNRDCTSPGWHGEPEGSCWIKELGYLAIFDGHGGSSVAERLRQTFQQHLQMQLLSRGDSVESVRDYEPSPRSRESPRSLQEEQPKQHQEQQHPQHRQQQLQLDTQQPHKPQQHEHHHQQPHQAQQDQHHHQQPHQAQQDQHHHQQPHQAQQHHHHQQQQNQQHQQPPPQATQHPHDTSSLLASAFASFDQELLSNSRRTGSAELEGSSELEAGSTALVVLASGCALHFANLGDCRAVAASTRVELQDEEPWAPGTRVEVREARSAEMRGQRGIIVEIRSAPGDAPETRRVVYVVRLFRDGELRPFRASALKVVSELRARRLTADHKPDAPAERERIEALGGKVEVPSRQGGSARVAGLATSRSFGGLERRPFVSAEPEIWWLDLQRPDSSRSGSWQLPEPRAKEVLPKPIFVVLASDGIWDVLEDQLVVDLVWDLLGSAQDPRHGPAAALQEAAQMVVQAAKDRGSLDNLTCAIVLLGWHQM
ncbi:unnamed protein product [Polarella glacialis]|uniref:Uncharacterized protein n=2 Tax=Polarella glacialis TaxID=89957 RepID=A0A813H089_POLGL|nr:unnamed protein product [Polarella glacialis]